MSLQCDYFRKLFDDYINNDTLPAKQKKLITVHLKTCDACRKEYNKELKIMKAIKDIPLFHCPHRVVQRIENKTYGKNKEVNIISRLFNWIFISHIKPISIGMATAIIIIIVTLSPFSPFTHSRNEVEETMYTTEEIKKAKKEAELSLAYIGQIFNDENKKAVNSVLLDRFPKIIRKSLKNSINIVGGE